MPHVLQANGGERASGGLGGEVSGDRVGPERQPVGEAEDQIVVLVIGTELGALFKLRAPVGEARWRTSTPNVIATGLVRQLSSVMLADLDTDGQRHIATMTDDEFWALLLTHPRTGPTAHAYRRDPGAWTATTLEPTPTRNSDPLGSGEGGIEFDVGRLYLDLPLVDGQPMVDRSHLAAVVDLPRLHLILQTSAPTNS